VVERLRSPRRRRFPEAVYDRAQELLNDPAVPSLAALADALAEEYEHSPSERALGEWVDKGWIARDARFGPWSMWRATPEETALVLPAVRFLIEQTGRLDSRPSNAIAEWIVKIRRVRPDLPIGQVLETALLAQADKANVQAVEAFLAGAIPAPRIGVVVPKEARNG
jgi:hypothetical protein